MSDPKSTSYIVDSSLYIIRIGERNELDRVVEADADELIKQDLLEIDNETNLDVVDDVAGVDNPYEEYVDEWNKVLVNSACAPARTNSLE